MCAMHFNRQPFASADGNDSDTIEPVSFDAFGNDLFCYDDHNNIVPETPMPVYAGGGGPARHRGPTPPVSIHALMAQTGITFADPVLQAQSGMSCADPVATTALALAPHSAPVITLQSVHPHVSRASDEDFNDKAAVDWPSCTVQQLYEVCTSQYLQCGQMKSMAFVLQHAVKQLTTVLCPFIPEIDLQVLKKLTEKGVKPNQQLLVAFEACCKAKGVISSLRTAMATYTAAKANVIRVKPGSFPELNQTVQDTLRLAAFMVDPRCLEIFGRMANPAQDRLAVQFPELRIVQVKQQLLEQFTSQFMNNVDVTPQAAPDISAWCELDYNVAMPPTTVRNWIWVRVRACVLVRVVTTRQVSQKIAEIKSGMTTLLANFNKSGDLSNSSDDHDRDMQFYQKFAKGQAMWFWIYMAWNHGRNVPAWNVALLPDEQALELGLDGADTSQPVSTPGPKSKRAKPNDAVTDTPDSDLKSLILMSSKWMEVAMKSAATTSSITSSVVGMSGEQLRNESLTVLGVQLKQLQDSITFLPSSMHDAVHKAISVVGREYLIEAGRGRVDLIDNAPGAGDYVDE
jgi:hypothetical protein